MVHAAKHEEYRNVAGNAVMSWLAAHVVEGGVATHEAAFFKRRVCASFSISSYGDK